MTKMIFSFSFYTFGWQWPFEVGHGQTSFIEFGGDQLEITTSNKITNGGENRTFFGWCIGFLVLMQNKHNFCTQNHDLF